MEIAFGSRNPTGTVLSRLQTSRQMGSLSLSLQRSSFFCQHLKTRASAQERWHFSHEQQDPPSVHLRSLNSDPQPRLTRFLLESIPVVLGWRPGSTKDHCFSFLIKEKAKHYWSAQEAATWIASFKTRLSCSTGAPQGRVLSPVWFLFTHLTALNQHIQSSKLSWVMLQQWASCVCSQVRVKSVHIYIVLVLTQCSFSVLLVAKTMRPCGSSFTKY